MAFYTNSPRSSKGRSDSFGGCLTSAESLTPSSTYKRKIASQLLWLSVSSTFINNLLCKRSAIELNVNHVSNNSLIIGIFLKNMDLILCWWSPLIPLTRESVVKQGLRGQQRGRQDVLVQMFLSYIFIHMALRVHRRVDDTLYGTT